MCSVGYGRWPGPLFGCGAMELHVLQVAAVWQMHVGGGASIPWLVAIFCGAVAHASRLQVWGWMSVFVYAPLQAETWPWCIVLLPAIIAAAASLEACLGWCC